MMKSITESLAGRIGLLTLLPFHYKEIIETDYQTSEFLGCYPEVVIKKYRNTEFWYHYYIETYIEKDARTISNIGNLEDFRRLMKMLAANCSQ